MTVKNGDVFYSDTSDNFKLESVDEAVEVLLCNDASINNGDVVTIKRGECQKLGVARFVPDVCDHISERAYDDYSDIISKFPDATTEVEKEIQHEVTELIVSLFEKHNLNPDFYDVINIQEIMVRIINTDNCEFEILGEKNDTTTTK